jgi:D-arginine dehydrogenase
MNLRYDIVVIGAGIAGASIAAELAPSARVLLLEMELQPGYHSTGRSAAYFSASYGSAAVRGITAASEQFYRKPPDGFTDQCLLHPRDAVFIARRDQLEKMLELKHEVPQLQALNHEDVLHRVPILDTNYLSGGLLETGGGDLEVDAILQGFLRRFGDAGGTLCCGQQVDSIAQRSGEWVLSLQDTKLPSEGKREEVRCGIIVNAAGSWAGELGKLAGLGDLGLQPRRRTALLVKLPEAIDASGWPLTIDVEEQFYFKPDAGLLLVSPGDETPSIACDARPQELDLALAMNRLEQATSLAFSRIEHKWAGLRTFAPDGEFVVGFDPRVDGFFWMAGQGGYGVQSAPSLAKLAGSLITETILSRDFACLDSFRDLVSPARLLA